MVAVRVRNAHVIRKGAKFIYHGLHRFQTEAAVNQKPAFPSNQKVAVDSAEHFNAVRTQPNFKYGCSI
jgi:hypothetical protein